MRTLAVIPARFASRRFPGKPLVKILDKPMIQWVWEAVMKATSIDSAAIATDDERIARAAVGFGARVVMTSPDHVSGSDRVAEVAKRARVGFVVNIQGDEPLIEPSVIDAVVEALNRDSNADIATPVSQIEEEEARNPDVVKVVVDKNGNSLYFSRALIPYPARHQTTFLRHIGIYAFRKYALLNFVSHEPSTLERIEGLEQLRALEMGMKIKAVQVKFTSHAVDRPEDIPVVEKLMREMGLG
ncbi:MAG: 3-deoxy-manno-octulosonate cytidylyltransferase [candidate division WOR-3 bacterium]